jgi:hypothetical protein
MIDDLNQKVSHLLRDPYEFQKMAVTTFSALEVGRRSDIPEILPEREHEYSRIWSQNTLIRQLLRGKKQVFFRLCEKLREINI